MYSKLYIIPYWYHISYVLLLSSFIFLFFRALPSRTTLSASSTAAPARSSASSKPSRPPPVSPPSPPPVSRRRRSLSRFSRSVSSRASSSFVSRRCRRRLICSKAWPEINPYGVWCIYMYMYIHFLIVSLLAIGLLARKLKFRQPEVPAEADML